MPVRPIDYVHEPRESWPPHIRPISQDGLGQIGVDPTSGDLYWDGKQLMTVRRFARYERVIAGIAAVAAALGAAGAVIVAVVEVGRSASWWD